ncbi:MAG: ATP-binding protein [Inquilinus sp.]|uniref:ATP-binding protein n=1 Tax=Inquilinus sp. TaxID=1932117 RepID=UPI003F2B33F8
MARYGQALLAVLIAFVIAAFLNSYDIPAAFATMLLAVMFSVWRSGMGPGLLAAILAIASIRFFAIEPLHSFDLFMMPDEDSRRFLLYTESILLLWLLGAALRRGQSRLARSEAYLADAQALSRTGSISFIVPDAEIFWSAEAYRVFGFDKVVAPSVRLMLDRIHPEDVRTVRRKFYGLTEPVQRIELEHRIVMPDASVKYLNILGEAEREKDGRLRISAAVMDITEARHTAELLRRSQAELAHVTRLTTMGELAASIAHEINQPLGAMKLSAQTGLRWLERQPPELERVEMSLKRIVDSAVRAEALIAKIRGMAKKAEAETAPVDLNRLVDDVVELLKGEAHERGIACLVDLAPTLAEVEGDPIQLQQILVNFLMNGFDAMAATPREEREIVIRSRHGEAGVILEVRDAGPGIQRGSEGRLFDAFFTTKAHGMGMGLSICRSIAAAHSGTIEAFNNDDRGATFRLTLPRSETSN